MKKSISILILVVCVALVTWLLLLQRNTITPKPQAISSADQQPQSKPIEAFETNHPKATDEVVTQNTNDAYILGLPVSDFYKLGRVDRKLEWKMPIDFWGVILDESNQPITDAGIHFIWNDISKDGTSEADTKSDDKGHFSLTNRRGKMLSVSVRKDDCYGTLSARQHFEYAQPEIRFVPDQNNPVIFHLRKKGEGAVLLSKNTELTVGVGKVATLSLDEQTVLQVELLTNAPMSAKQWAAHIRIVNGGIQPALEEFPFEAPLDGYEPDLELNLDSPKPPTWMSLYQGGQFYVKTAAGYGRLELKIIPGKTFMEVRFLLNPTKSRNLESK